MFSQFSGSANALNRGASYSNPRTAYDMTVFAGLRWGDFRLQGFFLEPDELPIADSDTQYLGTSLSYNNNQGLEAVLSYITVPQSNRIYLLSSGDRLTRDGLQVINPRLWLGYTAEEDEQLSATLTIEEIAFQGLPSRLMTAEGLGQFLVATLSMTGDRLYLVLAIDDDQANFEHFYNSFNITP